MTNPNDALGTNGAYGGRTSVNAFNDVLGAFDSRGILSGWGCSPAGGMKVAIGGDGNNRDVAIAEDNMGNRTTVNNISQAPIEVGIDGAPSVGSRIDAIVAYLEPSPQELNESVDNPGAVGLLVVQGAEATSPSRPTEGEIRSAITADGASGATAYYVVFAYVRLEAGTTDISQDAITKGDIAVVSPTNVNPPNLKTVAGQSLLGDGNVTIPTAGIDNLAVTMAKIANSSVGANQLKWSEFPSGWKSSTTAVRASGTGWTNAGPAFTFATAGRYLFVGMSGIEGHGSAVKHLLLRIYNVTKAAGIGSVADFYAGQGGETGGAVTLTVFGFAAVSAGDVVRLQFRTNSSGNCSTFHENGSHPLLGCVRIGTATP